MSAKVAIIAALEREVAPLVKGWRVLEDSASAVYRSYERNGVVVTCAGVGAVAAKRTAEKAVLLYRPELLVSAGLAGALVPEMHVGQTFVASIVINSATGERFEIGHGKGVLVSASGIAGPEAKRLLARHYTGVAVDMEAAAVAEAARLYHLPFTAVKAISDEFDFPVPELEPFVDASGRFLTGKFVLHTALHPGTWGTVRRLAADAAIASRELCSELGNLIKTGDWSGGARVSTSTVRQEDLRS